STEAREALYPAAQAAEHLQGFTREQLAEAFIVSAVEVRGSDAAAPRDAVRDEAAAVAVVVSRASGERCARCWRWSESVGPAPDHPQLCARCATVVDRDYGHGS